MLVPTNVSADSFDTDPSIGTTFDAINPTLTSVGGGSFDLQITEIWAGQTGDDLTEDWLEITNVGTAAWVFGVDPNLFYDDESADTTDADLIQGLTQIDPW